VNKLFPKKHQLYPEDYDMVYEKQYRPSQTRIIDAAAVQTDHDIFKSFQKKECYGMPKPPRNITTLPSTTKVEYSRYMYALANYVKEAEHIEWYAFSRTPRQVAERITDILANAEWAVPSDFSKFDGTISDIVRELERMILRRAFHPSCVAEVLDLHSNQFNKTGLTRFYVKYLSGTSRASGSPETSIFNTIVNAFIAYATWRLSKVDGEYVEPDVAWSKLGVYGGDDGLTPDIDSDMYEKTAKMFGLQLTTETIMRGDLGIVFLSRFYTSDVWFGDPNSCCDLRRQLGKFHTTVKLQGVVPVEKLLEKSRAFYLTDRNSPILGQLVSKAIELNGGAPAMSKHHNLVRFGSDIPVENQFPNEYREDYHAVLDKQLPNIDYELFDTWLASCNNLYSLLSPPLIVEPEVAVTKHETVVDGDVARPIVTSTKLETVAENETNNPTNRPSRVHDARAFVAGRVAIASAHHVRGGVHGGRGTVGDGNVTIPTERQPDQRLGLRRRHRRGRGRGGNGNS